MGAPLGWLFLRVTTLNLSPLEEVKTHLDLYTYLLIGTSVAFAIFGFLIGHHEDQLEKYSFTDALANIPNIRFFYQHIEKLHALWDRYKQSYALILFDLDNLKYINDHYGHKKGDQYIKHTAQFCSSLIRKEDTFARMGGDEFAILLPKSTLKDTLVLAKRLQQRIHEYTPEPHSSMHGSASFGCVCVDSFSTISSSEFYELADKALYKSKAKGKNTICVLPEEEETHD